MPPEPDDEDEGTDLDEEIRVMFVGATRARSKLSVGSSPGRQSGNVSGRVWKKVPRGRVQVEIGRAYDIDARGLVGRATFAAVQDARRAQEYISQNSAISGLHAFSCKELGWNFAIETPDATRLGALSDRVKSDLEAIAKRCESWPPPKFLPHIRSIGLRTIALRPDDPFTEQLHEPWRSSGFLLAPMLIGICMARFP